MNRPVASLALLATLATLALAAPDGDGLVGKWRVHDGKGKASGDVTIERAPKGERRFLLHWHVDTGAYDGIALLRQGHLYSAWGRGGNGIMVLHKEAKGWTGEWLGMHQAEENLGSETWAGGDLAGDHAVTGRAPNGNDYTGTLKVEHTGDTFAFDWTVGSETYQGIGLQVADDRVVVAYGVGNFGVMDYDVSAAGDEFSGRWSARGNRATATERLVRSRRD
jgi:hypothetical protein